MHSSKQQATQQNSAQHQSAELYGQACRCMPGGVNSPVRAFGAVGGIPVFMESAFGARIRSVDGRDYLDFCGSWGPLLFGHAHPSIVEAVNTAAAQGTSFGAASPGEVAFAQALNEHIPSMEKIRLVNSGTEAVMSALRLARGYTKRNLVIKFDGCYHGHSDGMLVSAGSGLLTTGTSSSAGVPDSAVADTMVLSFNNPEAVTEACERFGSELAAVIVEPIAGNMGLVEPAPGFLEKLRSATREVGALLIFDEVISGFRLGPSSVGHLWGVEPDITCLGKIIGAGLPIGAFGASAEIMDQLSPLGAVYQAGTLSGNPVAVAAGRAQLELIRSRSPYDAIRYRTERMREGLVGIASELGVEITPVQHGGMLTPFFCDAAPRNLHEAKGADTQAYAAFFHGMLSRGIYLPPSQFEVSFVSAVHTDQDIDLYLSAARETLREMQTGRVSEA
jgi:glutamate-1-semialdehyde 2,1-aminomutase